MQKQLTFLLWTPPYTDEWGGVIVLHRLAEILASKGYPTYTTGPTKQGSLAKFVGDVPNLSINPETTMVIYPEIVSGNPFNSKHITRWVLYTPGKNGGDGKYPSSDLVYKYWDIFEVSDDIRVDGYLRCIDTKKDFFVDQGLERSGTCHLLKKGLQYAKNFNQHPSDSQSLDGFINDEHLKNVFNQKEMFISYDAMSYHSIQAALCGCLSVVIPDPGVSKSEWQERADIYKYGIAYGLDDIQWAKDTMHLVRDRMKDLEDECDELVDKYIEHCKKVIQI